MQPEVNNSRWSFYRDKIKFLATFIWVREWELVRDEWNMTYEEWKDARERSDEICEAAIRRLIKAVEDEGT